MGLSFAQVLAMELTRSDIISWLIMGALAGSLVGRLFGGRKKGQGFLKNLLLGCGGALLGYLVFGLLDIHLGLDEIKITGDHLIGAVGGTIVLLIAMKFIGAGKKKPD